MSYKFGDFVLDEASRSLLFRDQLQDVQPRVFDLLCYLVKNAGRVVPKDELLDKLWPDVIVTDSSLQRAASLARRTLENGGLGHAIKNFAKRGYRFAIDGPVLGILTPPVQLRLLARQMWTSAKIDYHAARVRIELAQIYAAGGDPAGAEAEISAAERIAQRISSPRFLAACAELRDTAKRQPALAAQR